MAKFKASVTWEGVKKTGLYLSCMALVPVLLYAISKNIPIDISLTKDKAIKLGQPTGKTIEQANNQPANSASNSLEENSKLKKYIDEKTIPIERLPLELRGTPDEAITNIKNMYATFDTNIQYSFWMVKSEMDRNGTINTQRTVDTQERKNLYRHIQKCLNSIGSYNGPLDGDQSNTYAAVMKFQVDNSLTADGIIGKKTWAKMKEAFERKKLN